MNFLKRNWHVVLGCVIAPLVVLVGALWANSKGYIEIDDFTLSKLLVPAEQETEPPMPTVVTDTFPPLVDILPEIGISDFVVQVVNYTDKRVLEGFGVVVSHKGKTFVLTSRTIFSEGKGCVLVNGKPASIIVEDDIWELVALRVYEGDFPALELDNQEGLSSGFDIVTDTRYQATWVRNARSSKSPRNAKKNWLILTGAPNPSCGAPIFSDDALTGLVIGQGSTNPGETIAVNLATIFKLLEKTNEN